MVNSAILLAVQCPFWRHLWLFAAPILVGLLALAGILAIIHAVGRIVTWIEVNWPRLALFLTAAFVALAAVGVLVLVGIGLVQWWAEACK